MQAVSPEVDLSLPAIPSAVLITVPNAYSFKFLIYKYKDLVGLLVQEVGNLTPGKFTKRRTLAGVYQFLEIVPKTF